MDTRFLASTLTRLGIHAEVTVSEGSILLSDTSSQALRRWVDVRRADSSGNDAANALRISSSPMGQRDADALARTLESISRSHSRLEGIRRGRIHGAMSGREVSEYLRHRRY